MIYIVHLQHPHHPQNFCNTVCNSQAESSRNSKSYNSKNHRISQVGRDHSGSGPAWVIPKHTAQNCIGHSCAMKGWVWSTSDSWKSVCLESEFREDSRLLYVMSTSKVPKVQLCSLWIMVNIHQSIFLIIIYCNTNWSFIYPTKKCLRWVCFALLEKTRNYSTGKNLIHSKQNSAVLFIITYRMLTNITKSLQGKNSKVPSENFNLECLQTVCSHSILI